MSVTTTRPTANVSAVSGTSVDMASFTPTAGALLEIGVVTRATTPEVPTLSGTGWASGLTFTQRGTVVNGTERMTVFECHAPESPTAGVVTVTTSGTMTGWGWYIHQYVSDGDGAWVAQSNIATGTDAAPTVTLAQAPTELTAGIQIHGNFCNSFTEGTGFTALEETGCGGSPSIRLRGEYDSDGTPADAVVDGSLGASKPWIMYGSEITETEPAAGGGTGILLHGLINGGLINGGLIHT